MDEEKFKPPARPERWLVVDRQNRKNWAIRETQTAWQAFQAAELDRDGIRLAFSQVKVTLAPVIGMPFFKWA